MDDKNKKNTPAQKAQKDAYSKRPIWQWVLIYVVVAVVVYGVVYYFFMNNKKDDGNGKDSGSGLYNY